MGMMLYGRLNRPGEVKVVQYRSMVRKGYVERLLNVLLPGDTFKILREIGRPDLATISEAGKSVDQDARDYLLANWNDDIRDRVMDIIRRGIEP